MNESLKMIIHFKLHMQGISNKRRFQCNKVISAIQEFRLSDGPSRHYLVGTYVRQTNEVKNKQNLLHLLAQAHCSYLPHHLNVIKLMNSSTISIEFISNELSERTFAIRSGNFKSL